VKRRSSYKIPFEQYPAVRVVLLFIFGIVLDASIQSPVWLFISLLISSFLCVLLIEKVAENRISVHWSGISTLSFLILIISAGGAFHSLRSEKKLSYTERLVQISEWEQIQLSGRVENISRNSAGKIRLNLEVNKTLFKDTLYSEQQYKARILWDNTTLLSLGDTVVFVGTSIPISEPRNPSTFDYKQFLSRQEIYVQVRADSLISLTENTEILSWLSIREKALRLIDKNFDVQTSPIAKALLLGYKNELEGERKQAFARAGLSHIMAVSGLHVGLVVAPFWLIIPFFWTKKYGTHIGMVILISILIFYAGITGFSTPVLRASLMAVLLTFAKLYSKSSDSLNLMGFAALIILMLDPSQLFEIGFQLSFSAVLIILLVIPVIQVKIPYWIRIKWYGTPIMVIIISLVVQFGLYPLQAYYFGEISIISPLANAIFVPFLGIVVPLSLASLLITSLFPLIGYWINYPSLLFLNALNDFVELSASFSWGWMKVYKPGGLLFIFWTFLVMTIGTWRNPQMKWKLLAFTLAILCAAQVQSLINQVSTKNLRVLIFDVGQGDAALIQTPSGKNFLIDAGVWSPGSNSGEQILLPYFEANNINKLDAVFLSHPHADHIGGIIDLINEIEIDTIYNSGFEYDSKLYENYRLLAKKNEIPVKSLTAGNSINIDPSVLIMVFGPQPGRHNEDPNQHSLVLNVVYGESEFLFTGDAGEDQERRLVENFGDLLDVDFLKVGHHGSKTSSELFFLEELTPEIVTVSVGEKNRFRHPHKEAVKRLHTTGAEIYYTGRDRALIFESNGRQIQRIFWE